eukprot:455337-Pleurochrysis_carterae.AAC.3
MAQYAEGFKAQRPMRIARASAARTELLPAHWQVDADSEGDSQALKHVGNGRCLLTHALVTASTPARLWAGICISQEQHMPLYNSNLHFRTSCQVCREAIQCRSAYNAPPICHADRPGFCAGHQDLSR